MWPPPPAPPPPKKLPNFAPKRIVGPFSRTDSEILTQSGVFSLGMGIAQKHSGWQYKN